MIRLSRRAPVLVYGFGFVARTAEYGFIIEQVE